MNEKVVILAKPQVLKLELYQNPNLLGSCFKSFLPFIAFKLGLDNSFKALVRTRGVGCWG